MDIDRFWNLIEQARAAAGPAVDQAVRDFDNPSDDPDFDYWDFDDTDLERMLTSRTATGDAMEPDDGEPVDLGADEQPSSADELLLDEDLVDPVARALADVLAGLPAAEIVAFENRFAQMRDLADRDDLANVALLIEHGFLGEDSFEDFRAGLVMLGRDTFERALGDPDSLADHPLVQEIASARDPRWFGHADLLYAASTAYAEVTGEDEFAFMAAAEKARTTVLPQVNDDKPDESGWDIEDEAETRRRVPRLAGMFYEHSLRNRRRVIEKLGLTE